MSVLWVIYFAEALDRLQTASFWIAVILLIAGAIFSFVLAAALLDGIGPSEKNKARLRSRYSVWFCVAMVFVFLAVFTPSRQTIYMMAAVKVGQDIVASPETKEVSSKVLKLINQKLDEQLSKTEEKK